MIQITWQENDGTHHTGYLLEDRGYHFVRDQLDEISLEMIHVKDTGRLSSWICSADVLVVPHFQSPHSIQPVWIEISKLSRQPMRKDYEQENAVQ